jgi:16S rRNA (adenine1518-N6/adenine1519-N6)-dimethyltransferase
MRETDNRYKNPRYRPPRHEDPHTEATLRRTSGGLLDNPLLTEAKLLRLKRRFSQNFLINPTVLANIANALALKPGDLVLEIGAGAGFLTEALLKTQAHVTAVELDRAMCLYLQKKFMPDLLATKNAPLSDPPNRFIRLVEGDFLRVQPDVMDKAGPQTAKSGASLEQGRFKVVGNLPYGITSRIMFKVLGEIEEVEHPWRSRIEQMTVMVQKEVAERITAKPGQKAYNALSIALQLRFQTRIDFIVPSKDFYPAPKVDSALISLILRKHPLIESSKTKHFGQLVRTAFSAKRKTLRNALIQGKFATADEIDAAFHQTGIDPRVRAEALSIEELGALTDAFGLHPGQG